MNYFVRFFTTMAIGLPLCVIVMKDTKSALLLLFSVLATVLSITQHVYFWYIEEETKDKENKHNNHNKKAYKRQISDFFFYHNMYLIDNRYKNPIFYDVLIKMLIF